MYIQVRLTLPYDSDLVALTDRDSGVDLSKLTHKFIRAAVRGENFYQDIPKDIKLKGDNKRRVNRIAVDFNEKEEEKEVEFLKSIPEGERNAAIKNIIRHYLPLSYYFQIYGGIIPEAITSTVSTRTVSHTSKRVSASTSHTSAKSKMTAGEDSIDDLSFGESTTSEKDKSVGDILAGMEEEG